jgi:hypothetical protein
VTPASLLARTFASPYLGREPKARVVTTNKNAFINNNKFANIDNKFVNNL